MLSRLWRNDRNSCDVDDESMPRCALRPAARSSTMRCHHHGAGVRAAVLRAVTTVRRMRAAQSDNEKPADRETHADSSRPALHTDHARRIALRGVHRHPHTEDDEGGFRARDASRVVLIGRGCSLPAQRHLVRGLALRGEASPAASVDLASHDVRMCCRNHLAVTTGLGRAEDAPARRRSTWRPGSTVR
jgi:hypothetical protein